MADKTNLPEQPTLKEPQEEVLESSVPNTAVYSNSQDEIIEVDTSKKPDLKSESDSIIQPSISQTAQIPTWNIEQDKLEMVKESELRNKLIDGTHALKKGYQLNVIAPDGTPGTIPAEDAQIALSSGYSIDPLDAREARGMEEKYGDRDLETAAIGLASGLSFGIIEQILVESGLYTPKELKNLKETNKYTSTISEIFGTALPLVFTGGGAGAVKLGTAGLGALGKKEAAKQISKGIGKGVVQGTFAGVRGAHATNKYIQSITAKGLEKVIKDTGTKSFAKKVIEKTLPTMAGSAAEGAFYGAGQLIREDAIGDAELNAENLLAFSSQGALWGGAFGGGISAVQASAPYIAKGIGGKFQEAKGVVADKSKNIINIDKAIQKTTGLTSSSLDFIKRKSGKNAQQIGSWLVNKAEQGVFTGARSLKENILKLRRDAGERIGNSINIADELNFDTGRRVILSKKTVAANVISKIDEGVAQLRKVEGNKKEVKKLMALRREFQETFEEGGEYTFTSLHEKRKLTDKKIPWNELKRRKPTPKEEIFITAREELDKHLKEGLEELGNFAEGQGGILDELLSANEDYMLASDFLPAISKKVDRELNKNFLDLSTVVAGGLSALPGSGGEILFAANLARKAAKSEVASRLVILSNVEKQANKNAGRITKALDNFLSETKKSAVSKASKVKKATPPVASMLGTSFDSEEKPKKGETKQEAFKRIQRQIIKKSQNPQNLMDEMDLKTARIQESAPKTAKALKNKSVRALVFLNSKLPRNPKGFTSMQPKFDDWEPSTQELNKFERYFKAVMDPVSSIEGLIDGSMTREEVESIKVVYPKMYQQLTNAVVDKLSNSTEKLSYSKRLQLGILLDSPTDASLLPENIQGLQMQFDPGSRKTGAGVSSQGIINPTVTGITGIDAADRAQTGVQSTLRRRQK